MKLIVSVVRAHKMDAVKQALRHVRALAFTSSELRDHTPQRFDSTVWRGHEYCVGFSPKVEIKVVADDDDVDEIVGVILRSARTGEVGDGFVSVVPVEHRYRIHDGKRDVA